MRCTLLQGVLLPFFQALPVVEDKFNTFPFGIDLQGCIECLTALGGHAFYLHSLTLHEVFVLSVRKCHALDFLGNVHTVGTQGHNFVGLRVDRDVGGKRFAVLGGYLNGLAEIACRKKLLLLFRRELIGL